LKPCSCEDLPGRIDLVTPACKQIDYPVLLADISPPRPRIIDLTKNVA
jgi:hypothetical protein